ESSHQKGLGHLIRAMNLIKLLKIRQQDHMVIVNDDPASVSFLKRQSINFCIAEIGVLDSNWETGLIKKHKIDIWVNDRLDTALNHAMNVKRNGIPLICIDDRGSGAELADINFGSLPSSFGCDLKGKKVFVGLKYLVLDKAIEKYKKKRKNAGRILVTLGGSDTYGVTVKVAKILKEIGMSATIVTGPLFEHWEELNRVIDRRFIVKNTLPSLIKEFADYDLAVTGGGLTPFEANASGLPCIIIANETFEMPNGNFLSKLGSSVYAGYREEIKKDVFTRDLNIEKMSALGIDRIRTDGADNIYEEIDLLWPKP
ncbi:MAG: glycosyl transferase, partial [Candidatus Omnitrophica bacterium]|nr:glycosyl transferase [Candidatus Omnitrophota bacterium]